LFDFGLFSLFFADSSHISIVGSTITAIVTFCDWAFIVVFNSLFLGIDCIVVTFLCPRVGSVFSDIGNIMFRTLSALAFIDSHFSFDGNVFGGSLIIAVGWSLCGSSFILVVLDLLVCGVIVRQLIVTSVVDFWKRRHTRYVLH
jgi:hypothetical protein